MKKPYKTSSTIGVNESNDFFSMKAVVILPTYNERESIVRLLARLTIVAQHIRGYTLTFLVVDDNSPDGTQEAVKKYQKKNAQVFLITGKKQGLGKALLRGMTYAVEELGAEILVQMDADLSHAPEALPSFFAALDQGGDFVVGSRYIPGGSIPENWALHRKIFSIAGNAIVRFGLGYSQVHDWTGGYRALRKHFFEMAKAQLQSFGGYVFQIAFLHKSIQAQAKIIEVPIHFTDRRFGHSKIAPSQYIRDVVGYVISARIRSLKQTTFFKFCVVGTIGFVINTVVLEAVVALGFHPTVGSVVGAELAIISNFVLNNTWTFGSRRIHGKRTVSKFLQFNTTSVGAIIIQASTIAIGTFLFGLATYRWFYILGVGIGLVWNYTLYSLVIWKKPTVKTQL